MNNSARINEFEKLVRNKYNVYNSIFLNLPFQKIKNVGILIPLIYEACLQGLHQVLDPMEILDAFFRGHTALKSEAEKIDFMFRVIQYIERQVVLYDSVEDAAFPQVWRLGNHLSIKDYLNLSKGKKESINISDKLSTFSIRIVFTAHPTQFYPPAVLDIIAKLRELITRNDINEIDITLQQLGLTSLINSQKPKPFEEAKNIIYFLKNVYYDAVGELYGHIKKSVQDRFFDNPDIIQLGFWPGGDRDGNPYVTWKTTNAVADELRMTLMKCYYRDIQSLRHKLTFRKIEDILAQLEKLLYGGMFDASETITYAEIIHPLLQIRDLLVKHYNRLYLDELENLIDKVKIFKIHFATLDIRQNHSIHQQTVQTILQNEKLVHNSLEELEKEELIFILLHKNIQLKPEQFKDKIISDTIQNISQLPGIQHKNGESGCNRYIISNSEDEFSVLFVFALLRWCGWRKGDIPFDIIPLFESMAGMKNAINIMQALFEIPEYRAHVKQRGDIQTIMLGFSDGTKDGGYLQANWSIFKTKEDLSALCSDYNIKAIFFDGRGGPPARGGGKTHRFYAAQGRDIANHAIQLTIQGQTITSTYGTKEHFMHNCEQLLTAGLSNSLFQKEHNISPQSRELLESLGRISFEKYQQLKNHKMFVPYLENKSTLKYYGKANIGSRPIKRGDTEKLEFKDLRAIPFVGSWSQLRQNIPGYFGIGSAIQALIQQGQLSPLKKLFREVLFFKALILNSMMSLSKCNFELTSYLAKDPDYKEFWNILFEEYKLSKKMVLLISGYNHLMEEEPISRNSIAIREGIVLPLLVIQQYALQKIEQGSKNKKTYEKIVERSLYGNINASRNSA
ncbi:MAG: phosphoenolpyruvate carboxylase [bacterium]|nr:MAG: phosphoenolpyruvate carboxylase [bacterium]